MKNSILTLALVCGLMVGCSSQVSNQEVSPQKTGLINLHIKGNNIVVFEGAEMSVAEFEKEFSAVTLSPEAIFQFIVDGDVDMGVLTDIQAILREKGVLRINYVAAAK